MEVDRPTYQPMQGAWYRVLTLDGRPYERMQYRDGAFHGISRMRGRDGLMIPLAEVERVALRPRPGYAGGSDVFHVLNAPTGAPPAIPRGRPPAPRPTRLTLVDSAPYKVRTVTGREVNARWDDGKRVFLRIGQKTAQGRRYTPMPMESIAAVATGDSTGKTRRFFPLDQCYRHTVTQAEATTWIHPIRRRALGLPPVTRRDDVVPLDFSDPRRVA